MCSYNQVNGEYACTNYDTLSTILKSQFEFDGFVMSDWWASSTNVDSVNAGLDMMMPGSDTWGQDLLTGNFEISLKTNSDILCFTKIRQQILQ